MYGITDRMIDEFYGEYERPRRIGEPSKSTDFANGSHARMSQEEEREANSDWLTFTAREVMNRGFLDDVLDEPYEEEDDGYFSI